MIIFLLVFSQFLDKIRFYEAILPMFQPNGVSGDINSRNFMKFIICRTYNFFEQICPTFERIGQIGFSEP